MDSKFAVIYKYDIFGKVSVNHMVVVVVRRQGLINNVLSDSIIVVYVLTFLSEVSLDLYFMLYLN